MIGPFDADDDQAPITHEEREGLIPTHVALRSELNELEQPNIARADRWAFSRRRNLLDEAFLRGLHRRMFGDVWKRAGAYRTTSRNPGIDPCGIQTDLRQAIDDARCRLAHDT
jgi:fido (protein-threonine AMPylation protein)